jgi:hypothetical protein
MQTEMVELGKQTRQFAESIDDIGRNLIYKEDFNIQDSLKQIKHNIKDYLIEISKHVDLRKLKKQSNYSNK